MNGYQIVNMCLLEFYDQGSYKSYDYDHNKKDILIFNKQVKMFLIPKLSLIQTLTQEEESSRKNKNKIAMITVEIYNYLAGLYKTHHTGIFSKKGIFLTTLMHHISTWTQLISAMGTEHDRNDSGNLLNIGEAIHKDCIAMINKLKQLS